MNTIWPPAPNRHLPPEVEGQNDEKQGVAAYSSFWLSLAGLLTVFVVHIINYTGLFQNVDGVWFFQITSLDSRIDSEFFYFGGYLITGYFLIGIGVWLGVLNMKARRGRQGLFLGVCFIVLDIIVRIGVPLIEPKDRTVRIEAVLSVAHWSRPLPSAASSAGRPAQRKEWPWP